MPLLIVRLKTVRIPGKPVKLVYREMLRKILYPTDFSGCSWKALEYVKKFGEAGAKEAVIMHVRDARMYAPEIMKKLPKHEQIDIQTLNSIERELGATGIKAKTLLVDGIPFVEINKAAEKENASLIVMGSHGRSMVEEMLVGSVCGKIVRRTKISVLVVTRGMRR